MKRISDEIGRKRDDYIITVPTTEFVDRQANQGEHSGMAANLALLDGLSRQWAELRIVTFPCSNGEIGKSFRKSHLNPR